MGSLLQAQFPSEYQNGLFMNKVSKNHPEAVQKLHEAYIQAGATIITTNTYRTNPLNLRIFDPFNEYSETVFTSCAAAQKARPPASSILIAGSNGPVLSSYDSKLRNSFSFS